MKKFITVLCVCLIVLVGTPVFGSNQVKENPVEGFESFLNKDPEFKEAQKRMMPLRVELLNNF